MTEYNSGDAVALAVDDPERALPKGPHIRWGHITLTSPVVTGNNPKAFDCSRLVVNTARMSVAEPLSDTFYKNCLASGAITPPLGESAAVRRSDLFVGWCAICFVVAGVGAFLAAMWWR